jgi:hypothetical protein
MIFSLAMASDNANNHNFFEVDADIAKAQEILS